MTMVVLMAATAMVVLTALGWYDDDGTLSLGAVLSEALTLALPSRCVCEDTATCDERLDALCQSNVGENSVFEGTIVI